ncbi:MAG: PilN domain-containing protein [Nitrospirae bacterium]|nr:PilN domain-containing protein [Nitrospirota bacterium]
MIRINLLPTKKKKKKPKPIPGYIAAVVIITVILVIILVFVGYQKQSTLNNLRIRKQTNEEKLKDLRAKLKKLRNYEKLVVDVEKKKKIIIDLRKNQALPVKILDELSRELPNGVWLSQLSYNGSNINLMGSAFTNSDVVKYVNNLKRSKLFKSVFLAESKFKPVGGKGRKSIAVYNFKITMTINKG